MLDCMEKRSTRFLILLMRRVERPAGGVGFPTVPCSIEYSGVDYTLLKTFSRPTGVYKQGLDILDMAGCRLATYDPYPKPYAPFIR